VVTDQLPKGVRLTSTPAGCSVAGSQVTCALGSIPNGESRSLTLPARVGLIAADQFVNTVSVTSDLYELHAGDNQAQVSTSVYHQSLGYANDFSYPTGAEWLYGRRSVTPSGRAFLGEYSAEYTSLSLNNLPNHNLVTVSFDLYVIRSWNGMDWIGHSDEAGDGALPDIFQMTTDQTVRVNTTFSNHEAFLQSYPGSYPGGRFPAFTGAFERNTLGYLFRYKPMDATYRFKITFPHTRNGLVLTFAGLGLQVVTNESWGLDNLQILIHSFHQVYAPLSFR
jgi:hypothetical protein